MPCWNSSVFSEILSHIIGGFAENMREKVKKIRSSFITKNGCEDFRKTAQFFERQVD